jgi:hypothetical protein
MMAKVRESLRNGVAVLLIVSSWLRSRFGLWLALVCAAVPLSWVVGAILASAWE